MQWRENPDPMLMRCNGDKDRETERVTGKCMLDNSGCIWKRNGYEKEQSKELEMITDYYLYRRVPEFHIYHDLS